MLQPHFAPTNRTASARGCLGILHRRLLHCELVPAPPADLRLPGVKDGFTTFWAEINFGATCALVDTHSQLASVAASATPLSLPADATTVAASQWRLRLAIVASGQAYVYSYQSLTESGV